eukprot:TRINITY_DN92332_c0_g1_i1.p1 TRINITY_DN92332_c0_g1~~TRINITY_DN92332_c0_g1_i1.p1  ORF type:complete len:454 (-),score=20.07 TRINITY_DN92332_c0_g1_i1:41-1318(-)
MDYFYDDDEEYHIEAMEPQQKLLRNGGSGRLLYRKKKVHKYREDWLRSHHKKSVKPRQKCGKSKDKRDDVGISILNLREEVINEVQTETWEISWLYGVITTRIKRLWDVVSEEGDICDKEIGKEILKERICNHRKSFKKYLMTVPVLADSIDIARAYKDLGAELFDYLQGLKLLITQKQLSKYIAGKVPLPKYGYIMNREYVMLSSSAGSLMYRPGTCIDVGRHMLYKLADCKYFKEHYSLLNINDQYILVLGDTNSYCSCGALYNIRKDSWIPLPSLPVSSHNYYATVCIDRRYAVVFAKQSHDYYTDTQKVLYYCIDIFDIDAGWSPGSFGTLKHDRVPHTVIQTSNSKTLQLICSDRQFDDYSTETLAYYFFGGCHTIAYLYSFFGRAQVSCEGSGILLSLEGKEQLNILHPYHRFTQLKLS